MDLCEGFCLYLEIVANKMLNFNTFLYIPFFSPSSPTYQLLPSRSQLADIWQEDSTPSIWPHLSHH